jgi:drug/metabolite transporter (DMT)-like permease
MQLRRGLPEWSALVFLISVWGSSFALTKIAVQTIPPIWIPAIRLTLAAVLLGIAMTARKTAWPRGLKNWLWLAWFAVIGNIMPFFMISWATQHVASSLAGILMAINPLLVLLLARFLLADEPVRVNNVVGFMIGFAGVVTLIGPAAILRMGGAGIELAAQLALIAAAFGYAAMNVTARLAPRMDLTAISGGTMAVAALIATSTALVTDPGGLAGVSPASMAAVLVLGIFPTALATLAVYWLVRRAGSRFLATSNYAVPAFAVCVGWVFLGERLDPGDLAGFALIIVGITISERPWRREKLRPPSAVRR